MLIIIIIMCVCTVSVITPAEPTCTHYTNTTRVTTNARSELDLNFVTKEIIACNLCTCTPSSPYNVVTGSNL